MIQIPEHLTELPNIGKAIAGDLVSLGIKTPSDLIGRDPLKTFKELAPVMGNRHDPCVLYVLMAVQEYLDTGESKPWWEFTAAGRKLIAASSGM